MLAGKLFFSPNRKRLATHVCCCTQGHHRETAPQTKIEHVLRSKQPEANFMRTQKLHVTLSRPSGACIIDQNMHNIFFFFWLTTEGWLGLLKF